MAIVSGTPPTGHDLSLSIGDLSARTGVTPTTLRIWEERHGFPEPSRRASGHRRYSEADAALVSDVSRLRESGMRLDAAIAAARREAEQSAWVPTGPRSLSVHAAMLRHSPHLTVYRLRKPTLIALSHAIEDEFCVRARDACLFGLFQRVKYFESARVRWRELARLAGHAYVFTDFPHESVEGRLAMVQLDASSPLASEWAVVCDATEVPVALSAWEVPGQQGVPERRRIFEATWTLDPETVRVAAGVCVRAARDADAPDTAAVEIELAGRRLARADPRLTEAFFNRAVSYLDRAQAPE